MNREILKDRQFWIMIGIAAIIIIILLGLGYSEGYLAGIRDCNIHISNYFEEHLCIIK